MLTLLLIKLFILQVVIKLNEKFTEWTEKFCKTLSLKTQKSL